MVFDLADQVCRNLFTDLEVIEVPGNENQTEKTRKPLKCWILL